MGLTPIQVVENVGIDKGLYSKIESGYIPSKETSLKIARVLNFNAEQTSELIRKVMVQRYLKFPEFIRFPGSSFKDNRPFDVIIRQKRIEMGLIQKMVADSAGIDERLYNKFENGLRPPRQALLKIADVLGFDKEQTEELWRKIMIHQHLRFIGLPGISDNRPFDVVFYEKRIALGLSQNKVADEIGTERTFYSFIEGGSRPNKRIFMKITKALNFNEQETRDLWTKIEIQAQGEFNGRPLQLIEPIREYFFEDDRSPNLIIYDKRRTKKWNQTTVAVAAGMSRPYFSTIENGFRPPESDIIRIAKVMNFNTEETEELWQKLKLLDDAWMFPEIFKNAAMTGKGEDGAMRGGDKAMTTQDWLGVALISAAIIHILFDIQPRGPKVDQQYDLDIKYLDDRDSLDINELVGRFIAFWGLETKISRGGTRENYMLLSPSKRRDLIYSIASKVTGPQAIKLAEEIVNKSSFFEALLDEIEVQNPEIALEIKMARNRTNKAMITKSGGIDLTSDKALSVQNNGQGIRFHIDPAQLQELQNAPGFVPVIINIQPLNNLKLFLGIDDLGSR